MAQNKFFEDTFTESSNTALDAHTPDTGTSWTEIKDVGSATDLQVNAASDVLEPAGTASNDGKHYSADATYNSANYQVSIKLNVANSSSIPTYIWLRVDADASDGYFARYLSDGITIDPTIGKVVSDSVSSLGTHDNGLLSGVMYTDGDTAIFQIYGTEIILFGGNNNETSPEIGHIIVTDSDISDTNKAGIGMGAFTGSTGDDLNNQEIDDYEVWELAGSTEGWSSPTTTGETDNDFTNPTNAYSSDDSDATTTTIGHKQDYGDFGFTIPAGSTIRGISVKLESGSNHGTYWARHGVEVSNDNGSTWSDQKAVEFQTSTDATKAVGHARSLWGLEWAASDLNDTDFRVRIEYLAEEQ
jgi:hypothetical protein